MKSNFDEHRANRIAGLKKAAEKAEKEGDAALAQASEMASVIPMGQPILVGHYSEGPHRRYLAKIDGKMRKGIDLGKKAAELASRAISAAENDAIFSDDPQATEKLADKIERLEKRQQMMKDVNKLVRKNDRAGLAALGFNEARIDKLLSASKWERGFQTYELTNNGANIRRLKERLADLEKHAQDETKERTINGVRIVDNVEDNRLQMFFKGKPSEATRNELKAHGFHWSSYLGCWQRMRSNDAIYYAKEIAKNQLGI